jgi:hypothetical protein
MAGPVSPVPPSSVAGAQFPGSKFGPLDRSNELAAPIATLGV